MANSDVSLDVLIRSVLDATGYRMNEAEANRLKTSIGQVGAVSTTVNADDAAGTDKLILKKRELMHVINALGGSAVPELSKALSMLAYGAAPAAAIFALIGVFEMVRRHIEAVKKAAADLLESRWETIHESIDDAVQSADDLADALEKAGKPADAIKVSYDASKALLDAQIDDHKKLLDALEKEELAAAKGDKDKEAAIRARYDSLKREYDLAAEQMKLDQLSLDIATRKGNQFHLNDVTYSAREALASAQTNPALMAATEALKGKNRTDLIAANGGDKYASDVDARIAAVGADQSISNDTAYYRTKKLLAEKALKEFDENTQIVKEHSEEIRRLKNRVIDANAAAAANTQVITEETAQRESARGVLEEHQAAGQQQAAIAKVQNAGGVDSAISGGLDAIDALMHGQKLDEKGQQAYQAFRAVFESVHANLNRIISIDEQNAAMHQSHTQRLNELEVMYKNLLSRVTRPNS